MANFFFTKLLVMLASVFVVFLVASPKSMAFSPTEEACKTAPDSTICKDSAAQKPGDTDPALTTIKKATTIIAILAGFVAVVMLIVGGITFITSGGAVSGQRGGDSAKGAAKGRAMVVSAIIGLVIIALAWTIITFAVTKLIN